MQPSLQIRFRTFPHPSKTLVPIDCWLPFSPLWQAFSRQKTRLSFLPEIERAWPWAGLLRCLCQVQEPYEEHWGLMSCDALFPIGPLSTLPNFFFFHFSHLFCCAQHSSLVGLLYISVSSPPDLLCTGSSLLPRHPLPPSPLPSPCHFIETGRGRDRDGKRDLFL